jgi:hypothetical protein
MVQTVLITISILIQVYIVYILHRSRTSVTPQPGGEAEKKPRRLIPSLGLSTVESNKRSPKVNDDETLYERERKQ